VEEQSAADTDGQPVYRGHNRLVAVIDSVEHGAELVSGKFSIGVRSALDQRAVSSGGKGAPTTGQNEYTRRWVGNAMLDGESEIAVVSGTE
jgi:hypothetical protein